MGTRKHIVINLHAFLPHMRMLASDDVHDMISSNALLFHALLVTLTLELAHVLERGAHHGAAWRSTHAELLSAVCANPIAVAAQVSSTGSARSVDGGACTGRHMRDRFNDENRSLGSALKSTNAL